jgi:hypothetical protein
LELGTLREVGSRVVIWLVSVCFTKHHANVWNCEQLKFGIPNKKKDKNLQGSGACCIFVYASEGTVSLPAPLRSQTVGERIREVDSILR